MNVLILYDESCENFHGLNLAAQVANKVQMPGFKIKSRNISQSLLNPCSACFGCWTKTPGVCIFTNDAANDINGEFVCSHAVVLISKIVYGCYSYHIKSCIDRLIPIISPYFSKINGETHHKKRYAKYPCFAVIGYGGNLTKTEKATFKTLVKRNSINLHAPGEIALVIENQAEFFNALDKLTDFLDAQKVRGF